MTNAAQLLRPFWIWQDRQQMPPLAAATYSQILVLEGTRAVVLSWDAEHGGDWRDTHGQIRDAWTLWQPVMLPQEEASHE